MVNEGNTYEYQYFLKDHLENTRVTFTENDEIRQEDTYYPFGMQMNGLCYETGTDYLNKNLYNGKELQSDFGLDWHDYGARFYDAQIGRFPSSDPIIEEFPYLTPYNYASNNPVTLLDLWGLQGVPSCTVNAFINGSISRKEFNKINNQQVKMSKYPLMFLTLIAGNGLVSMSYRTLTWAISAITMPTSLGITIAKDIAPNESKIHDFAGSLTGCFGMVGDKFLEISTGEKSKIFQTGGDLLENIILNGKGLFQKPENALELYRITKDGSEIANKIHDVNKEIGDIIKETGDVEKEANKEVKNMKTPDLPSVPTGSKANSGGK